MDQPEHHSPQMPIAMPVTVLLIKGVMETHMEESHLEEEPMSRVDSIHMDVEITHDLLSCQIIFFELSEYKYICSLAFWHLGGGGNAFFLIL